MKAPPIPVDEADRLVALRATQLLDTPPDRDLDDLVAIAAQLAETPIALITLVDHDRQWFKAKVGLDAASTPRDVSFCGHAILGTECLVVPDSGLDERFWDNPLVTGDPHVRAYLGAPLVTQAGHRLGTICAIDTRPHDFPPAVVQALERLARQVTSLIEHRAALRDLADARAALVLASQERTAILEAAPLVVFAVDRSGRVLFAQGHGLMSAGIEPSQYLGGDLLSEARRPEFRAALASALEGRPAEVTIDRAGRYLDVRCVPRFAADGRPDGAIGVVLDVTARERLDRARREIVGTVAHELQAPLRAVRASLDELEHHTLAPRTHEVVAAARQVAARAARVADDLLLIERAEADALELVRRPADLGLLLAELVKTCAQIASAAGARLELGAVPTRTISVDEGRVLQCLTNLVVNAVKFSPPGGVVRLDAEASDDAVRIRVADEGPGLAPGERERLFERFLQLAEGRKRGGSGLGLAITRALVAAHGGTVGVESELGRGSTFWIELPAPRTPVATGRAGERLPAHVLVVDDEPLNRILARGVLARLGAQVREAAGGEAALELLRRDAFDLVLLDLRMPGIDGVEVARRLGEAPARGAPMLVGWSASVTLDVRQDAATVGLHEVISKQMPSDELARVLDAALDVGAIHEPTHTRLAAMLAPGDLREVTQELAAREIEVGPLLERALADDDRSALAGIGHSLRASTYALGARRCSELAAALERDAADAPPEALLAIVDRLRRGLSAAGASLRALSA